MSYPLSFFRAPLWHLLLIALIVLPSLVTPGKITEKNILKKVRGSESHDAQDDNGNTEQCRNDRTTCNPFETGDDLCYDEHAKCHFWAEEGECEKNPEYMKTSCRLACEVCEVSGDPLCKDFNKNCDVWASKGECENNSDYMLENCAYSCQQCIASSSSKQQNSPGLEMDSLFGLEFGVRQTINGNAETQKEVRKILQEAASYMKSYLTRMDEIDESPEIAFLMRCYNKHSLCAHWASTGECTANAEYMTEHCGPVCKSCGSIGIESPADNAA